MENIEKESTFKFGILVKSFEAFKQIKAIILLLLTVIISAALLAGASYESVKIAYRSGALSFLVLGIGIIIAAVIFLIGYTATGKILFEFAKNKTSIKTSDAVLFSVFSFYKFIISEIILFIIPLIVVIAALIYFLIAKIPDLGSLLSFIGIPAFTIIFSIVFIGIVLASFIISPIIFEGNSIKRIFVKTFKIFKKHDTLVFGYFIFINLVVSMVGFILFILITASLGLTTAVLTLTRPSYLNSYGGFSGYGGQFGYMGGMGALQSIMMYGKFIGFGIAIVYMLLAALLSVYMMLGMCHIYIDVTKDMDFKDVDALFDSTASRLKSNIDKYKEKAAGMSQNGGSPSENHNNQNINDAGNAANAKFCPQCGTKNKPDASFCENCGAKLN